LSPIFDCLTDVLIKKKDTPHTHSHFHNKKGHHLKNNIVKYGGVFGEAGDGKI